MLNIETGWGLYHILLKEGKQVNNKPYITPDIIVKQRLGKNPIPNWDMAILCFHGEKRSDMLVSAFNARPLGYKVFDGCGINDACECIINGKKVGIIRCCRGGGTTANIIEELAYMEIEYVVGYGAAASITRDITKGTQVIVVDTLNTDGVSRVYCPNEEVIKANKKMISIAQKVSTKMPFAVLNVRGVTTNTFYRETENLIAPWRKSGVQVLNVELSPLYASAEICNISTVWIGHISDRLLPDSEWEEWFSDRDRAHDQSILFTKELIKELTLSI